MGGFGIVPESLDGAIVSSHYFLFEINEQLLDRSFFKFFIRTPFFCEQVAAQGSTNYAAIRPQEVLTYQIPLPPLDEQRRIVARIEELAAKVEEARGLRRQSVEEADSLLLSSLSQIFNYQVLDTLPQAWKWKPLSEILLNNKEGMITGPFGTLLQKSDIQLDGVPVLGIANVQANRFVPGFSDYVSHWKAEMLASYKLEPGDIVIARSGTVGRSCVVPLGIDPAPIMSTNLIRLRLDQQTFIPELLCRLFNGSRLIEDHKDSECRGSTRSFFTQTILLKLKIPAPPLPEQRHIVAYLDNLQSKVDALKRLQTETAAELDALLPSILDKAFKGEL
jgi:type I restriction enzyme S subunit